MRVLLYEYTTGGGLLGDHREAGCDLSSLAAQGRAIASALADDFASLHEVETHLLRDHRLADWMPPADRLHDVSDSAGEDLLLEKLAADCDWTLIVAPETSENLRRRCHLVRAAGGRLLGPPPALVALASDKQATADYLRCHGVPAPRGQIVDTWQDWPHAHEPCVAKPRDGAGSDGVLFFSGIDHAIAARCPQPPSGTRMEPYQHGLAASVAVIGGPAGHVILPPCEQRIDKDGGLRYRGGRFPLGRSATAEAIELAGRVVDAIDPFVGYIGIDLVLTDHGPVAIEINPRLTTSYVGLRAATPSNLAEVMLSMAEGGKVVVTFTRQVSFSADGDVERMESLAKAEPFVSQWRPASRSACGGDNSRSQH